MRLPHKAAVLVADGRKMLFLRNEGDAEHPNLVVERAAEQKDASTADQGTDRPGNAPRGGDATGRNSFAQTDWHQLDEDRFAADAADLLKRRALSHDFDTLVVVAPPRTLGELRKHYHKEVSERLACEIDKDLTGHPVDDIERTIANA